MMNVEETSLTIILEEYILHLSSIESEDKLYSQQKQHQPAARFESDFVANIDTKEVVALFRNDYIRDADIAIPNIEFLEAKKLTKIEAESCDSNLVDEMRSLLSDEQTIDDLELLMRLDSFLEKKDLFHKSHAVLKSSISQTALSLYKERNSSSDSGHMIEAMLTGNDEKVIVKRTLKRKGIKDEIPPANNVVKKFRRRRRFGILGMSNAEMTAAAKAAAAGTNLNTSTLGVNSNSAELVRPPVTRRQTLSSTQHTKQPAAVNDLKWIIRGGTKVAKGNAIPSDILRALVNDLEDIGIGMKGFDIERKFQKIQMNHNLCIRSMKDDSKVGAEETKDHTNHGGDNTTQNDHIKDEISDIKHENSLGTMNNNGEFVLADMLNYGISLSSADTSTGSTPIKESTDISNTAVQNVSMDIPTITDSTLISSTSCLKRQTDEGDRILLPMKASLASENGMDLDNKIENKSQNLIKINEPADSDPLPPLSKNLSFDALSALPLSPSLPSTSPLPLSSFPLPPPSITLPQITSRSHIPPMILNKSNDLTEQSISQSLKGYSEGGKHSVSRSASAVSYIYMYIYISTYIYESSAH